ncbi:MAG: tetratricopeptide repeat protein, partial [Bacteroidia bacterium]
MYRTHKILFLLLLICSPVLVYAQKEKKIVEKINTHLEKEEYDKAIAPLTKLINMHPDDAKNYYVRGLCYKNIGQLHNALNDYNKAIKLKDYEVTYLLARGKLYNQMRLYDKAIKDFKQTLELYPKKDEWLEAELNMGVAYCESGDSSTAIACYKAMLQRDPKSIHARNNWALQISETKPDSAEVLLEEAFNIDSSNIYTRHNLVYIARFTGNYKRAVEVSTDESIENTPMKA